MFRIFVQFKGETDFQDTFTPVEDRVAAEKVASCWKKGCFTYDKDAIVCARVLDEAGTVVHEIN